MPHSQSTIPEMNAMTDIEVSYTEIAITSGYPNYLDSDIYEDPAVRYESLIKRRHAPSAITMKQYLVPYGFVATDENGDGKIMDVEVKQDHEVILDWR